MTFYRYVPPQGHFCHTPYELSPNPFASVNGVDEDHESQGSASCAEEQSTFRLATPPLTSAPPSQPLPLPTVQPPSPSQPPYQGAVLSPIPFARLPRQAGCSLPQACASGSWPGSDSSGEQFPTLTVSQLPSWAWPSAEVRVGDPSPLGLNGEYPPPVVSFGALAEGIPLNLNSLPPLPGVLVCESAHQLVFCDPGQIHIPTRDVTSVHPFFWDSPKIPSQMGMPHNVNYGDPTSGFNANEAAWKEERDSPGPEELYPWQSWLKVPKPMNPGCDHTDFWRRLRLKKGVRHYFCKLCGYRWKIYPFQLRKGRLGLDLPEEEKEELNERGSQRFLFYS